MERTLCVCHAPKGKVAPKVCDSFLLERFDLGQAGFWAAKDGAVLCQVRKTRREVGALASPVV
jgi:hypothetical protein